jgi:hypothetical protein
MKILCKGCLRETVFNDRSVLDGSEPCPYCKKPLIESITKVEFTKVSAKKEESVLGKELNNHDEKIYQASKKTEDGNSGIFPSDVFFVLYEGEKNGPFSISELREKIRQQIFPSDILVSKNGLNYVMANTIPALVLNLDGEDLDIRVFKKEEREKPAKEKQQYEKNRQWNMLELVKGIATGLVSGIVYSVFAVALVYMKSPLVLRYGSSGLTQTENIIFQIILWCAAGGFTGGLFSILDGILTNTEVYSFRMAWIGAPAGILFGLLVYLNGWGIQALIFWFFSLIVLSLFVIFLFRFLFIVHKEAY